MLGEVFGWIGEYARGLLSILPQRRIVKAGHGAILYGPKGGIKVLGPGWYVVWLLFQEFEDFPIARQTRTIAKEPMVTQDGRVVSAGGIIRWSVEDLEAFCVDNLNTFDDVDDVAQIAIRDVIASHTYDVLLNNRKLTDKQLKSKAQRQLTSYGVRVHGMSLKSFAPAQIIHMVGDSAGAPTFINQGDIQQ